MDNDADKRDLEKSSFFLFKSWSQPDLDQSTCTGRREWFGKNVFKFKLSKVFDYEIAWHFTISNINDVFAIVLCFLHLPIQKFILDLKWYDIIQVE